MPTQKNLNNNNVINKKYNETLPVSNDTISREKEASRKDNQIVPVPE